MLTDPLSERDIARRLFLSFMSVHSHTKSIYHKLAVFSPRGRREEGTGSRPVPRKT